MAAAAAENIRPLRRVEYDKLVALGVFEGERIELIDGALRHMSPIGEPEPDVCVLPLGDYHAEHPQRAHLIIEVAESSLSFDRGRKARLYAECGVPEYWIVNLVERTVEVHCAPDAGQYRQVSVHQKGARLRLVAFADVELSVDDFLR